MVNKCRYQISSDEYKHYTLVYVKLVRLEAERFKRINIHGINVYLRYAAKLRKGDLESEIAVDNKIVRIYLVSNSLNLKIFSELFSISSKRTRMFTNDISNKSILKQNTENECKTSKTVSFNNTFFITPISPRQRDKSPTPIRDYEFAFKEYLKKSVQMNGSCTTPEKEKAEASPMSNNENNNTEMDDDDFDEESMEVEYLDPPKRKRGRPKGSGKVATKVAIETPPKKRGWPLGLSRKMYNEMKSRALCPPPSIETGAPTVRKRGRPRKIIAFGFQTIVSDIKTVSLPSDLWSAHVSVTAKKSQVCFTRVVQAVSNSVPVECDRSVKFNGSVNYLVRINNRDVELLAAPPTVNSLRDVEILLEIVNEIGINDPVLEYHNR